MVGSLQCLLHSEHYHFSLAGNTIIFITNGHMGPKDPRAPACTDSVLPRAFLRGEQRTILRNKIALPFSDSDEFLGSMPLLCSTPLHRHLSFMSPLCRFHGTKG